MCTFILWVFCNVNIQYYCQYIYGREVNLHLSIFRLLSGSGCFDGTIKRYMSYLFVLGILQYFILRHLCTTIQQYISFPGMLCILGKTTLHCVNCFWLIDCCSQWHRFVVDIIGSWVCFMRFMKQYCLSNENSDPTFWNIAQSTIINSELASHNIYIYLGPDMYISLSFIYLFIFLQTTA